YKIHKRLTGRLDIAVALAMADIIAQMTNLIYQGLVTQSGYQRLPDIFRYLQAIDKRLDKLATDSQRVRMIMLTVEQMQHEYQKLLAKWPAHQPLPAEIKQVFWMIEELRVNLFAQQLGTPYAISDKRIRQYIAGLAL